MNSRLLIELCILDVLIQTTRLIHAEDIQEAGIVVERVAVDIIRRLFSC